MITYNTQEKKEGKCHNCLKQTNCFVFIGFESKKEVFNGANWNKEFLVCKKCSKNISRKLTIEDWDNVFKQITEKNY